MIRVYYDQHENHKQKYHEAMLILLKDIAKQFGNSVDESWLAGFGVPSNVIPRYVDGVGKVKTELLQSYRWTEHLFKLRYVKWINSVQSS